MTRSQGERIRLEHSIARFRALLDGTEIALRSGPPPGTDLAQAFAMAGVELAMIITRLEAYDRAEREGTEVPDR